MTLEGVDDSLNMIANTSAPMTNRHGGGYFLRSAWTVGPSSHWNGPAQPLLFVKNEGAGEILTSGIGALGGYGHCLSAS